MNVLPVIERELRVQARLTFTYWLRVLGASALLLLCLYFWNEIGSSTQVGGLLFNALNIVLLLAIWVLVPLSCADCISRERREGTLGLLFLTPLKAREIILSKGFAYGLRALTLWLATAPILTICFLIGGVSWNQALFFALINFSSICWALAAGLLASSATKSWLRAMVLAGCLAVCFTLVFADVIKWTMWFSARNHLRTGYIVFNYFGLRWLNPMGTLSKAGQRAWLLAGCETAVLSVLFLLAVVLVAAWMVRRAWREEPPSARRVWVEKTFTRPIVGVNFFHRWLRRKLEHNPIGWLEQRSWSGRLVTWGWFAVMVSFYSFIFNAPNSDAMLRGLQGVMAWSLLLIICVSAAGSFQRERETRVLELLLISPMTVSQIIRGRVRGLWGQFLPALVLMLVVWIYLRSFFHGDLSLIPFFCSGFFALPVIGLYYSLKRANFISALLSTIVVGLLLPEFALTFVDIAVRLIFLGLGIQELINDSLASGQSIFAQFALVFFRFLASPNFRVIVQIAIAIRLARKLNYDLEHRNFPFSKGVV